MRPFVTLAAAWALASCSLRGTEGLQSGEGPCEGADLRSDPAHCGACDWDCEGGDCVDGRCTPVVIGRAPEDHPAYLLRVGERNVYFSDLTVPVLFALPKDASMPTPAVPVTSSGDALWGFAVDEDAGEIDFAASNGAWRGELPNDAQPAPIPGVTGIAWSVARTGGASVFLTGDGVFQHDGDTTLRLVEGPMDFGHIAVNSAAGIVFSQSPSGVLGAPDFTCNAPSSSRIATLDNLVNDVTLASGQDCAVAVRAGPSHAYWTESDGGTVQRVPLAGGDVASISSGHAQPFGLAIDDSHVYWVVTGTSPLTGELRRATLDGHDEELLAGGLPSPMQLELDDRRLYFTCFDGSVQRMVKPSGNEGSKN